MVPIYNLSGRIGPALYSLQILFTSLGWIYGIYFIF